MDANKLNKKKPIVIVGAGITGLTCGYLLSKKGIPVIILEREKKVGGLAKSFQYNNFKFDIGPHRFYSSNEKILDFIKDIIGKELLEIERNNSIYFKSKYYNWPLTFKDLLKIPPLIAIQSLVDLFRQKQKETRDDLKSAIINKYGKSLYEHFFNDFCWKFFQTETSNIHKIWSFDGINKAIIDERININNLKSILKYTFLPYKSNLKFLYPVNGIDSFCENLSSFIQKAGGEVHTGKTITRIEHENSKIKSISVDDLTFSPLKVIWTGSLVDLCRLFCLQEINLHFISLLLFNIAINKPLKPEFQWCYFPERKIIFIRISIPSNFSLNLIPKNKGSLCIELPCREGDESWKNPEKLIDKVTEDLMKIKLVRDINEIESIQIEKIKEAYPLYEIDYKNKLEKAKKQLCKFKNLKLAGRSAEFWYNNMDESINRAFEIVEII